MNSQASFSDSFEYQKGKWVFMEKTVLVQPEIKKLNFRIDADGNYTGTVWYDDLKIEKLDMSQNEIVSETNYYPFGLAHKGYNEHVNSTNLGENWKYQGQERTPEMDLNIDEWKYRVSDPAIGRFWQIDPITHYDFSPYVAFDNAPIFWADPSGADAGCPEDDPNCNDKKIAPVVLDEVVVSAPKKESGMPAYMRFDNSLWTSSYSGNLDQYNQEFGTSYTHNGQNGTAYSQWQYEHFYKPAYDDMISDIHSATSKAAELTMYVLPTPLAAAGSLRAVPALSRGITNADRFARVSSINVMVRSNDFLHRAKGSLIRNSYNGYKQLPRNVRKAVHPLQRSLNREQTIFRQYIGPDLPTKTGNTLSNFKHVKRTFLD